MDGLSIKKLDEMDWMAAELHLTQTISKYLHLGSLGVLHHMNVLHPLWQRFRSGDRTQELYDEIMEEC